MLKRAGLHLLYALIVGLVGAAIVHIAILLLLPNFSDRDAWSKLAMAAGPYRLVHIDSDGDAAIDTSVDPLFEAVACRLDLADGIVRVVSPGSAPFWSVSVYDRGGQNVYSFNDRTAEGARLDFVLATPAQMIELRKDLPEAFIRSVFVEIPLGEGIAVVRAFVPDASWSPTVARFLDGARCELQPPA